MFEQTSLSEIICETWGIFLKNDNETIWVPHLAARVIVFIKNPHRGALRRNYFRFPSPQKGLCNSYQSVEAGPYGRHTKKKKKPGQRNSTARENSQTAGRANCGYQSAQQLQKIGRGREERKGKGGGEGTGKKHCKCEFLAPLALARMWQQQCDRKIDCRPLQPPRLPRGTAIRDP